MITVSINTFFPTIPFAFIFLGIINLSAWLKHNYAVYVLLPITMVLAWHESIVDLISLPLIFILFFLCWMVTNIINETKKNWCLLLIGVITIIFFKHKAPGFNAIGLIKNSFISKNACPYSLYLCFDKSLTGIAISTLVFPALYIKNKFSYRLGKTKLFGLILVSLISIIGAALITGFVRFEPKFHHSFYLWALNNLLLVCFAEEFFYRGLVQQKLQIVLCKFQHSGWLAILLTSLLFGAIHFNGDLRYLILTIIASICYGLVYLKTNNINWSIFIHFLTNTVHFLFFTYPGLI